MINGNIQGIKQTILDQMEALYELEIGTQEFASPELLELLAQFSGQLNREISVFISRNGQILDVSVGENDRVSMPVIRQRRAFEGLSGVRCIHTHPSGSAMLSGVDIGTLLSTRLDAMAAVGVKDGKPAGISVGFIGKTLDEAEIFGPYSIDKIPQRMLMTQISFVTQHVSELIKLSQTHRERERAILIGLNTDEYSMEELQNLAQTAGALVVHQEMQNRPRSTAYVGKGKAQELSLLASELDADVLICDDELTPIENKNLEDTVGIKVVDRTALILDIFARHAVTKEGKLQVELAQLEYNLPRLTGWGTQLSRTGAGIGTKGPGEKKLETDRRRIRRRIYELKSELSKLSEQRSLRRENRIKNRIKEVALVGYTNAGKSSLLNALCDADVLVEDKLFATLDPVTRKVQLPGGQEVLFSDTVGFTQKLPHDLIEAFKSTLEQTKYADLVLNIIDASNPYWEKQSAVVHEVLKSLGVTSKCLDVFNKADATAERHSGIYISAKNKEGLTALLEKVEAALKPKLYSMNISLGYDRGDVLAFIKNNAHSLDIEYNADAISITAKVSKEVMDGIFKMTK